jgi:hypothetical protein
MTFSPNLGRWLEEDPIRWKAGDPNFYRFEFNSPINLLDPLGLACDKEYKFPPGLVDALDKAWTLSNSGTAASVEQGGSIFQNQNGEYIIRPIPERRLKEKGEGFNVDGQEFPRPPEGQTVVGIYHTHPTKPGEVVQDVPHSRPDVAGDLVGAIAGPGKAGYLGTVSFVRSPNCIFVLKIDDAEKCKTNFAAILKKFQDTYTANNDKPLAERQEAALLAAVKDSGFCYYKVCKKDGKFPANAPLVAN